MKAKKLQALKDAITTDVITAAIGDTLTVKGTIISKDIALSTEGYGGITFPDGTTQTTALEFTPIQQGGGIGQEDNKVMIGWNESTLGLRAQVTRDGVVDDLGCLFTSPTSLQLTLLPLTNNNPGNAVGGMLILSGADVPQQKIGDTEYPAQIGENLYIDAWARQDIGNLIRLYRGNTPQPWIFTFNCDTGLLSAANIVTSLCDVNATFKLHQTQIALLDSQLTAFEKQLNALQDKSAGLDGYGIQLQDSSLQLTALTTRIDELDKKTISLISNTARKGETASISRDINDLRLQLEERLNDLSTKYATLDNHISLLQTDISKTEHFNRELSELKSQMVDFTTTNRDINDLRLKLDERLDDLNAKYSKLDDHIAVLQTDNSKTADFNRDLTELKSQMVDFASVNAQIRELINKSITSNAQILALDRGISDLQNVIAGITTDKQIDASVEQLPKSDNQISEVLEQIKKLSDDINYCKSLGSQINRLHSQSENSRNQVAALDQQLAGLIEEINKLRQMAISPQTEKEPGSRNRTTNGTGSHALR